MADVTFSRSVPVTNRRRYYGSIRSVLLVRFDPGNRDTFSSESIQRSDKPSKAGASRRLLSGFNIAPGAPTNRPVGLDFRAIITQARVSLASALKVQPVDGLSRFFDLQPLKSTRQINSYRKADELDLTLNWKDFPIDSRLIRAILILHYEGTVRPEDWASGDRDRYLVPPSSEHLRFVGLADEVEDLHDEGGDVLSLRARDLTSLLIDSEVPTGTILKIDPEWTIVDVIGQVLALNEGFDIIRGPFLRASPDYQPPKFVETAYFRTSVSAKERWRVNGTGAQPPIAWKLPSEKTSYWDLITDLCVSTGFHPTIELDALVIFEPRTVFRDQFNELTFPGTHTFPRPGGHRWTLGERSPVRRVVFGSDILSAAFSRKLGRITAPAVKVVTRNPDAEEPEDRLVEAVYPPTKVATKVSAAGQNPTQQVFTVKLPGKTHDLALLQSVAKQIYESMGRQELGVSVPTNELASHSESEAFDPNLDPDLLAIGAGDPVEILVAQTTPSGSGLVAMAELSKLVSRARSQAVTTSPVPTSSHPEFSSALEQLRTAGFGEAEAKQFVDVLISANLPTSFRVNQATVAYDDGFSVSLDLRDYVRVRADVEDPTSHVGSVVPGGVVT